MLTLIYFLKCNFSERKWNLSRRPPRLEQWPCDGPLILPVGVVRAHDPSRGLLFSPLGLGEARAWDDDDARRWPEPSHAPRREETQATEKNTTLPSPESRLSPGIRLLLLLIGDWEFSEYRGAACAHRLLSRQRVHHLRPQRDYTYPREALPERWQVGARIPHGDGVPVGHGGRGIWQSPTWHPLHSPHQHFKREAVHHHVVLVCYRFPLNSLLSHLPTPDLKLSIPSLDAKAKNEDGGSAWECREYLSPQ